MILPQDLVSECLLAEKYSSRIQKYIKTTQELWKRVLRQMPGGYV
jgi:hypothetical protein